MRYGALSAPTLRARVTAWAVLAAAVLAVAIYIALLALQRRDTLDDTREELAEAGRQVMRLILNDRLHPRILSENLIQVTDDRGALLAASTPIAGYPVVAFPPPTLNETRTEGRSCHVRAPGGRCFLVTVFRLSGGPQKRLIYILAPEPPLVPDVPSAMLQALPIPLVMALTGYATWRGAGRVLRPVEEIRAELIEITATDLQRRVPVPDRDDEIARLARCVNSTLDRLEGAVARLRGFVFDASHELRSPLTGLMTELDMALSETRDPHLREVLEALLDSADRLHAVLNDLLSIAKLESGPQIAKERIDLQELADECVLARPRRARFAVEGGEPVSVRGGRSELTRLLTNLVDNADRHAASSVTLTVATEPAEGGGRTAVIEVYDDGPGIAPEDRERVFERFIRLSEGRHRDAGGTGLGLAISRDIATAHGGSLVLTDRLDGRSGARFVVRLPALPPEENPPAS
jgi:signal transduction histidine kinase